MRILLDQNLSPKLIRALADIFPGLETVCDHDLIHASDRAVFEWARASAIAALITAGRDLVGIAERRGAAPASHPN